MSLLRRLKAKIHRRTSKIGNSRGNNRSALEFCPWNGEGAEEWAGRVFGDEPRLCEICSRLLIQEVLPNYLGRFKAKIMNPGVAEDAYSPFRFGDQVPEPRPYTTLKRLREAAEGHCAFCSLLLWSISDGVSVTISYHAGVHHDFDDGGYVVSLLTDHQYIRIHVEDFMAGMISLYAFDLLLAPSHLPLRQSPVAMDDEESSMVMKSWIQACRSDHSECHRPDDYLPTRILDISGTGDIRLRITNPGSEPQSEYVALSYCWGTTRTLKTELGNILAHQNGIRLADLPKTIRDAVELSRTLGFRCLWVDALCIIQDSSDDWASESGRMADVFGRAFMTLCASGSNGADVGMFPPRRLERRTYLRMPITFESESTVAVLGPKYDAADRFHEPISQRAWTLQEQLLARRVLTVGTDALSWRCRHAFLRTGPLVPYQGSGLSRRGAPVEYGVVRYDDKDWETIVQSYNGRHLTNLQDKLPALAGVARVFSDRWRKTGLNVTYLAGLWEHSLISHLLWTTWGTRTYHYGVEDQVPYVAPSWSWASSTGEINCSPADFSTVHVEILDCTTQPSGPDVFGRVSSGKLVLRGPATKARLRPGRHKNQQGTLVKTFEDVSSNQSSHWLRGTELTADVRADVLIPENWSDSEECVCILVGEDTNKTTSGETTKRYRGLVLGRIHDGKYSGCFQRIGVWETSSYLDLWRSCCETPTLTIV